MVIELDLTTRKASYSVQSVKLPYRGRLMLEEIHNRYGIHNSYDFVNCISVNINIQIEELAVTSGLLLSPCVFASTEAVCCRSVETSIPWPNEGPQWSDGGFMSPTLRKLFYYSLFAIRLQFGKEVFSLFAVWNSLFAGNFSDHILISSEKWTTKTKITSSVSLQFTLIWRICNNCNTCLQW